ncbi:beta-carotene isomerase D27 [Rhynchospora pubera]|uniref:Beta-carotene isomerase D27 n=1 Tax=Rhynchospora pubera TaxID=906938 RepID=A0AAV8EQA7_9POAL|nr:beta-carotene isomerase D27 [Rhynchospora pubera]
MAVAVLPFSFSTRAPAAAAIPFLSPTKTKTNPPCPCRCSANPNPNPNPPPSVGITASLLDPLLLNFFRAKMVHEVGWDSPRPGYDGLIQVANRLLNAKSNQQTQLSALRVLKSLFPTWLLVLFKMLVAPIAHGQLASMMLARATALSCKWLMGPCSVNSVLLPHGNSCSSGVFVERCKYLEESKCIGICINTCKLPTQAFFKDYMGVELYMEPNFEDYSCQFNFGVPAVCPAVDKALKEPCLEICTNANRRRELGRTESDIAQCPQL